MSDLMPLKLVAQALAVSPATVYRLVKSGHLPAVKIGGDWRVRRADLERFVCRRLHRFGLGVVKPFFFRSSVLAPYRTSAGGGSASGGNSREYYLHESGFHGRLGLKSGWHRPSVGSSAVSSEPNCSGVSEAEPRKRGLQPGVAPLVARLDSSTASGATPKRGAEFCELPFWKVPVTQEVIVITPKDFRKLPKAVQEHWRKYLILNQDLVVS